MPAGSAPGELPRAGFAIECGSGTYVRSLIADLGDAYCLELRRTAIGPFDVSRRASPPPRARRAAGSDAADRAAVGARPGARRRAARRIGCAAVKVTRLPDVERAAERSVAVGTFDGVHLGHREVIARLRQRAHVRSAPGVGGRPAAHAEAADDARSARPSWSPRSACEELIVIPFDAELRQALAPASSSTTCSSARSAPGRSRSARTSASATRRRATRAAGRRRALRHASCTRCSRSTARSSPRATSAASCSPARWSRPNRLLGARFSCAARSCTATSAAASSASRPPTWCPTRRSRAPGTASTRAWPRATGSPRPAAVSIGVRPTFKTGRGELIEAYILDFDGDLYGSELRLRVPRSACAASAASTDAEALVEQMHRDVERTRELVAASRA